MLKLDYDFIMKSVAHMEGMTFSDGWSIQELIKTMEQTHNKIYFLYGNEYSCGVYLLSSGNHKVEKVICHMSEAPESKENTPLGYIISNEIAGETELLRIAVNEDYRNKKLGSMLLKAYIDNEKTFCENFFLEVRCGNVAARTLYEKFSYKEIGIRKNYYSNPIEDAVIYGINFNN